MTRPCGGTALLREGVSVGVTTECNCEQITEGCCASRGRAAIAPIASQTTTRRGPYPCSVESREGADEPEISGNALPGLWAG